MQRLENFFIENKIEYPKTPPYNPSCDETSEKINQVIRENIKIMKKHDLKEITACCHRNINNFLE